MRNIVEYPITQEEAIKVLEQARLSYADEQHWFGTHGYIISKLAEFIEKHPELVDEMFGLKVQ